MPLSTDLAYLFAYARLPGQGEDGRDTAAMRIAQWLQSWGRARPPFAPVPERFGSGVGHRQPDAARLSARGSFAVMSPAEILARTGAEELVRRLPLLTGYPDSVMAGQVRPVVEAVADWVQCLPARSTAGEVETPLIVAALSVASRCLVVRRGRMLPPGAEPEAMAEDAHRWTYAVFVGALISVAVRGVASWHVRFMDVQEREALWRPMAGTLARLGALRYRITDRPTSDRLEDWSADWPMLNFGRAVPAPAIAWLAESDAVIGQLLGFLGGRSSPRDNAIHAIERQVLGDGAVEGEQANDSGPSGSGTDPDPPSPNAPNGSRSHNVSPGRPGERANDAFLEDFERDGRRRAPRDASKGRLR